MAVMPDLNNPDIKTGDAICGYTVKRIVTLGEIDSIFYELEHDATVARHIHISSKDRENTFSVAFKTVPSDSTGVAHVLEHTVLCGSKKFPVRDPFFSMLKRSLNTFMNAFTASDWTMYPFSTQNKKDFYNLMDVYLDSAFYPNLNELSFKQEGHRLEVDNESEQLEYKGVVYNEMKGAMSSPDQIMGRSLLNALYPSTTYSNNSGGDPAKIPDLTYKQLKDFHARHYHPSNSYFFTYGNLALKEHLAFINNKILKKFGRIDPKTDVQSQEHWKEPKTATYYYPLDKEDDPLKKCQVSVAWLTADIRDSFEILVLSIIEHILLGNSGSPLHKALISSGLGTALSDGTGFDSENKDTMFACGLKDVEETSAVKIESIIFDVLKDLVKNRIDKRMIESAIHQIEFHRKEVTNLPYPYGIKLLLIFCGSWFHGGDPVRILKFDNDLKKFKELLARGGFLENRLKKYFIDNKHRVLFKLIPDQMMQEKEKTRVVSELESIKSAMSDAELQKIMDDANALEKLQESDEDISILPTLEIKDIPGLVGTVKPVSLKDYYPAVCFNQPTSGIFYFSMAAGANVIKKSLLPMVPFFCYALPRVGTKLNDYSKLALNIDEYTGGVGLSCHAGTSYDETGRCIPIVSFGGKCLVRNVENMYEIIKEILVEFSFSDLDRLKSLLLEFRAGMESMVVQNGHKLAMLAAARNFSDTCALSEMWQGIRQLQTIKTITDNLSEDTIKLFAKDLAYIGKTLLIKDNIKLAVTGEDNSLTAAAPCTTNLLQSLGADMDCDGAKNIDGFCAPDFILDSNLPKEGWFTQSAVSFVAKAFKTVRMEHEDAPALSVISKLLRSLYLHREIREKGGAYGGLSVYNQEDGLFCFASYRDPHIISTMKVYDDAVDFIKMGKYGNEDIKEAILQVCSVIDKPDVPSVAAQKAFYRSIISLSDESRKKFKEQLLSLNREKVLYAAQKYFDAGETTNAISIVSSEEKLIEANKKIKGKKLELHKI